MQLFRNRRGDSRGPHALAAGLGLAGIWSYFGPDTPAMLGNGLSNLPYWDGDGKPAQQL